MYRTRLLVVCILLLALLLRLARFPLRFNQIAFAYAAYYQPYLDAIQLDVREAWTHFIGLHPPLYSLIFVGLYEGLGSPGPQLVLSLLFSCVGVWACMRLAHASASEPHFGLSVRTEQTSSDAPAEPTLWVGLLAATCVYLLHYALEVNNYPLLWCVAALSQWFFVRCYIHWRWLNIYILTVLLVVALYTHVLAGLMVMSQLLLISVEGALVWWRHRRQFSGGESTRSNVLPPHVRTWSQRTLAPLWMVLAIFLLCLPLLKPVLGLTGRGSTYHNTVEEGSSAISVVVKTLGARFGSEPALLMFTVAILLGVWHGLKRVEQRRATIALLVQLVPFPLILLLAQTGIAAAHQFPYYLLILPSALVLAVRGLLALGGMGRVGLFGLAMAQFCFQGAELRMAWHQVVHFNNTPQASREWLKEYGVNPQNKSDKRQVLMFIAPPLFADDDKRALDPNYFELLSQLPRGAGCAFYQPEDFPFEYVDYRFGQPYDCGKLIFYSFTEVYTETFPLIFRHHQRHGHALSLVLYDVETSPEYIRKVELLLETVPHECRRVGTTWLCRVEV